MIELLIKLMYASSDGRHKPEGWYAEQDEGGLWGIFENAPRFKPSRGSSLVYEADMPEVEAKLICLLNNEGIAYDWEGVSPYINMLRNEMGVK